MLVSVDTSSVKILLIFVAAMLQWCYTAQILKTIIYFHVLLLHERVKSWKSTNAELPVAVRNVSFRKFPKKYFLEIEFVMLYCSLTWQRKCRCWTIFEIHYKFKSIYYIILSIKLYNIIHISSKIPSHLVLFVK